MDGAAAPLVSILLPCWQAEATLDRCLAGLLHQSFRALEVVAVDDHSSDRTVERLERAAAADPRLRVLRRRSRGGPHAARTDALKASRAPLIGFADADDRPHLRQVEALAEAIARTEADIAIGGALLVDRGGRVVRPRVAVPAAAVLEDDLLGRFCRLEFGSGVLWNKLFSRRLFHAWPGDLPSSSGGEDYIASVGLFAAARRVALVPGAHYFQLSRAESFSTPTDSSAGFTRTLAAYATGLEVYAGAGEPLLAAVDGLFCRLLAQDAYRVEAPAALEAHEADLSSALHRIASVRPRAIYGLVHAFDRGRRPPRPSPTPPPPLHRRLHRRLKRLIDRR